MKSKEKIIKLATKILKDAYHKGTVYSLDYWSDYSNKEIQDVRVRRLLCNYGRFDWDNYNRIWHSFRINCDGIEFVESKKELVYKRKITISNILGFVFSCFVLFMIGWFIYVVIGSFIYLAFG